jgi:hypothetical protein
MATCRGFVVGLGYAFGEEGGAGNTRGEVERLVGVDFHFSRVQGFQPMLCSFYRLFWALWRIRSPVG